ncbi:hypothetical protein IEQ34_022499 [Dendrobium chrysotoxum]|uniref:Uncharacterized protein n=1 Tax=Dendrobium chrysotoxum TaxID=161865 RepID=A0AAV7FZ64_DENCH|nr:hypothetical protein IEQ34_022499 [Dendrobium chrysotoxum]
MCQKCVHSSFFCQFQTNMNYQPQNQNILTHIGILIHVLLHILHQISIDYNTHSHIKLSPIRDCCLPLCKLLKLLFNVPHLVHNILVINQHATNNHSSVLINST